MTNIIVASKRLSEYLSNPFATAAYRIISIIFAALATFLIWGGKQWLMTSYVPRAEYAAVKQVSDTTSVLVLELAKTVTKHGDYIENAIKESQEWRRQGMAIEMFRANAEKEFTALHIYDNELRAQLLTAQTTTQNLQERLIRIEAQSGEIIRLLDSQTRKIDKVADKLNLVP